MDLCKVEGKIENKRNDANFCPSLFFRIRRKAKKKEEEEARERMNEGRKNDTTEVCELVLWPPLEPTAWTHCHLAAKRLSLYALPAAWLNCSVQLQFDECVETSCVEGAAHWSDLDPVRHTRAVRNSLALFIGIAPSWHH